MLTHAQAQAALIVLALLPDSLDIMDFGEQVELYEPLAGLGGGRKHGHGMPDKPEPRTGHCSMHNTYEWWSDGDQLECN